MPLQRWHHDVKNEFKEILERGDESDSVNVVINVTSPTKEGEFLGQQMLDTEHEGMENVKFCLSNSNC